jgi:hypothetical protein
MTAYIANFMIKGYAAAGDLIKARSIFEGLEDPPEGLAAPNNHAPHEGTPAKAIFASTPVYREVFSLRKYTRLCGNIYSQQPSTWEAMVRAELGNGNREEALGLIRRLGSRSVSCLSFSLPLMDLDSSTENSRSQSRIEYVASSTMSTSRLGHCRIFRRLRLTADHERY